MNILRVSTEYVLRTIAPAGHRVSGVASIASERDKGTSGEQLDSDGQAKVAVLHIARSIVIAGLQAHGMSKVRRLRCAITKGHMLKDTALNSGGCANGSSIRPGEERNHPIVALSTGASQGSPLLVGTGLRRDQLPYFLDPISAGGHLAAERAACGVTMR